METQRAPAEVALRAIAANSEREAPPSPESPPPGEPPAHALPGAPDRSIPDYLESCIVDQDPSRYTAIDQAVWRFVLLQLHARLARTAHPSYVRGLAESGIAPDRIPSIEEMDRKLGAIGWRAVCVDGFIPPRAFQAFQALGILPIAAEIRSPEHLPYTPAPDIIHEAAGHAPILIDPQYAAYVRAAGAVASRAFASPADTRADRAVRLLSDLKENAQALPSDIRAAEIELERAVGALGAPSEAARVARLYWWTAEYGLVGRLDDYRLYGAGLLSSLGESHFCHGPNVVKLPLSPACVQVGYDITRPQPQLFVARDFEHLHEVLAEVARTLAVSVGGTMALRTALASRELCTIQLSGGTELIGTLADVVENEGGHVLCFERGTAITEGGRLALRVEPPYFVPVGRLVDGRDPRQPNVGESEAGARPGEVALEYAAGMRIRGTRAAPPRGFSAGCLWLRDFQLERPGRPPLFGAGPYPLPLADRVVTAGAGSSCAEVSPLGSSGWAEAQPRSTRPRVPKPRDYSGERARLEQLYRAGVQLRGSPPDERATQIAAVHAALDAELPHEWLLRWNLLEALSDLGRADSDIGRRLRAQLERLEQHYAGKHPIALGLDYLTSRTSFSDVGPLP